MKKNFRKIPEFILDKVNALNEDNFIVASVLKIEKSDINNAKYRNLGLSISDGTLSFNQRFIPNNNVGHFSKKNINGYRIVYKDQPKINKTFYLGERPVFGDWSKGSFSLFATRKVYPYDEIPPRQLSISCELLEETANEYSMKVAVNFVLNRNDNNYESDLFFALNLLQENVYSVDIFSSSTTREEYLRSLVLSWEIFPPGERDEDFERIINGTRNLSESQAERVRRNYDYLINLEPIEIISGVSGMRRYFGAKYSENLVVFENINYGNAVYVLFENWEELTQLSRTEIQNRPSDQYIRIKHAGNWQRKLERIIAGRRN